MASAGVSVLLVLDLLKASAGFQPYPTPTTKPELVSNTAPGGYLLPGGREKEEQMEGLGRCLLSFPSARWL